MASDDELEPTQTQSQTNGEPNIWLNVDNEIDVWGRLLAKNKSMTNFDLSNQTFSAGRANNCDYCFSAPNVPQKLLLQLSKVHFTITRDLSDQCNPAYLEDCSRNGTYVNREKIGKKNRVILKHNDTISIAYPSYEAFIYKDQIRRTNDLPPDIVTKYHVAKKLGSGACGIVYQVYDYKSCHTFALKQIKKNALTEKTNDKALNEAKIMKKIKHPCVVKMYDILDCRDSVCITLELMKGGDLLTRIQDNKLLPEHISKIFFYQMCHAIKYLHDHNITHRDLKPDNILLETNDSETLIKISDFGLSKLVQNNSALRTLCGTPLYVAPEILQTQGRGVYTEKVDIWSLGVVLFTCLSGTLPFANEYGCSAIEQIKKAMFEFRSKNWKYVSDTAKGLIRELLTANVDKRPSIDELLKHQWLNDYEMKCKAHRIMSLSPPPKPITPSTITSPRLSSNRIIDRPKITHGVYKKEDQINLSNVFVRPFDKKMPNNDDTILITDNGQPSKRRRIC